MCYISATKQYLLIPKGKSGIAGHCITTKNTHTSKYQHPHEHIVHIENNVVVQRGQAGMAATLGTTNVD